MAAHAVLLSVAARLKQGCIVQGAREEL
jgi:hypothetical protein